MFLDTFVCTSESSIPDLNDLQLECAVSLEAAYNDMVLENCQLKYQAMVEGVSVIHEGVIESIKNFFKAIFNAIKKFFGSSSSGGGGGSSRNVATLKKISKDERVRKGLEYLFNHPELLDKHKIPDVETLVNITPEELSKGLKEAMEFANNFVTSIANNPDSKVALDGDKIALETLRFFIRNTFVNYIPIMSAKIDSLADFKKALFDYTKLVIPSDLGLDAHGGYEAMLNDMDKEEQNLQKQKAIVTKQMEEFEKNVINNVPKEYAGIACKVAKNLTNASMIYFAYGCKVANQIFQETRQIFDMAMKINTKQS